MKLREYQQQAVDLTFECLTQKPGSNPLIAMPTGTGKSLVAAGLIAQGMRMMPGSRIMLSTHVQELIEQNADKLEKLWPAAPLGIYSAGLKRRETVHPITFAGMQSIRNRANQMGFRNALIIDECHLLSTRQESSYQRIIAALRDINPDLRVIGLTATHWRTKEGGLVDAGLFDEIAVDMTTIDWFEWFFYNEFLVPLIPRKTDVEMDMSDVSILGGEFKQNQMQEIAADDKLTYNALAEACYLAEDRDRWLIFASGNDHAERVAEILTSFGVSASFVHSGLSRQERAKRLELHRTGQIKALANNNILTTGYDDPYIDCIVMLRPTMSPGLWVQMLGRGTRPCPQIEKENCLVLDFARNTSRLGPINDPYIPRKNHRKGQAGEAPVRICPECGTYNHAVARQCILCETEFTFAPKIIAHASSEELVRRSEPVIEEFTVDTVHYYYHDKKDTPSIRVEYVCNGGLHRFNEYVCIEHKGSISYQARSWWRNRYPHNSHVPETVGEALQLVQYLKVPYKLQVHVNRRYPQIVGHSFYEEEHA